jgi:ADP-dependent phosphofructokinase/glucokinase
VWSEEIVVLSPEQHVNEGFELVGIADTISTSATLDKWCRVH